MKKLLTAIPLIVASPAVATTGLVCTTGGPQPIGVTLVVGHAAVPAIFSARLIENGREIPVVRAQAWLDPQEVRVDLVDRNAVRHEARVRATWRSSSRSYDGSLWRAGKRRWIRCREG